MSDKDLEIKIYDYFDNETPKPNKQILDELKIKMHQETTGNTSIPFKKFRLVLVSCIAILLIIPAVSIPFMWSNFFPSDSDDYSGEIFYSYSNLTMVDLTMETLNSILVGEYSKYNALLEDYNINFSRGYYSEDNVLVYLNLDINKNSVPFTAVKLNIVFVENYEHEYGAYFENITEFEQYENCKLYETVVTADYKSKYYKFVEFKDYKVYLLLDKQDSSIINTIIQN